MKIHTSRHGIHTSRGHLKKNFIPKIMSFIPKNVWFIPQNLCFIPRTSHGYLFDDTRYWVLEADWLVYTAFSDWLIEFRITTPGTLISQCFDWLHSLNSIYNWFKHRITFLNRWLPIVDRSAFRPHPPIGSYSADKRVDWWYYLPQYIIGAGLSKHVVSTCVVICTN